MIIITINIINRETPIIELIIIVFFFLFVVVSPNKSEDKSASFDIGLSSDAELKQAIEGAKKAFDDFQKSLVNT